MVNSYNRYTTEDVVQKASLIDMTKDVFAPGPDGRVALRMIHEGEYLGGPVADLAELGAIATPIVGEFHFVIDQSTWGVWDGTAWQLIGGSGPEKLIEGDAINILENGIDVTEATSGDVTLHVEYDTDHAVDLFAGKLGVKVDGTTIQKTATGELEAITYYDRFFHPVSTAYDIYGRPTRYTYDIEGDIVTLDVTYDLDGLRATIVDNTADIYVAPTKTYTYDNITRTGTIT